MPGYYSADGFHLFNVITFICPCKMRCELMTSATVSRLSKFTIHFLIIFKLGLGLQWATLWG